jgi:large subunit ribosomal protein L25
MERLKVKAEVRETGKKGVNRRLRGMGLVPAILYGHGEKGRALSVNGKEFTNLMKGVGGTNALIDLELAGGAKEPVVVMLKDFQTDTISHKITHIDLFKINLKEKVTVKIPLHVVGKSIGVGKGGLVEQSRREMEVTCLPDRIPDSIEVDITNLDMGNSIHATELKLPEGVELPQGSDFSVVSIVAPQEEEVVAAPVEVAAVAGAAPAAGGAAPAAAPAEGKAEGKGEKK